MPLNINGTTGISGVDGSASAPALQGTDSNTGINFASDTVNINTGGTTRATVNSAGNLGLGTTSPSQQLTLVSSSDSKINIKGHGSSTGYFIGMSSATDAQIYNAENGFLQFATNDSERMRIDNFGNILFNTTSESNITNGSAAAFQFLASGQGQSISTNNTGFRYQMRFYNPNGQVGYISTQNSATAFSTSGSDRALKENFEDWNEDVLSLFKNINPQKFNFIADDEGTEKTKGFVAQDMVSSFPEAYVKGIEEDAKYMFNPSGMVVYLMKALKEAQAKIETLETKVAALEAG